MPLYTQHYGLPAFQWGDIYSASMDQFRFRAIDNHLAFLSDQVGYGVIDGWGITDNGDGTVSIAPGLGIIGRKVYVSYGSFESTLDANSTAYFYLRGKAENGGVSGNSNIVSVLASDSVAPSAPTGLQQVDDLVLYLASLSSYDSDLLLYMKNLLGVSQESDELELVSYSQLAFQWTENSEADFSHYVIRRSSDPEYGVYEELGITTETIYIDTELDQNTSYVYEVFAVDLSGNQSPASEIVLATALDSRIPLPPSFVQAFAGSERLQVIWDHSASDNVSSYRVVLQPLNDSYVADGTPTTTDVSARTGDFLGSTYTIFEGLTNDRNYRVTVYAVSNAGLLSDGASTTLLVSYLAGAGEINGVDVDFTISTFENVGLETSITWRYQQEDPYLPYADKFYVTFIENGTRWSDPIEISESVARTSCPAGDDSNGSCYQLDVKFIPFNEDGIIHHESIREFTPYLMLIQTVDEDGNISNGVVERISRTPVSELVDAISDFSAERQTDNSILLSWKNPVESYFSYNKITVVITDLADPSATGETVYIDGRRIDRAEAFTISSSVFDINHRYTISVTSYDVFGTEGQTHTAYTQFTAEEDQLRPSEPESLFVSAGDTEVNLRWSMPADEVADIAYYRIYRASFNLYIQPSDFSLRATIPATMTSFTDYTVVNDSTYTYFVTAVDIYGTESLNTTDDSYMPSVVLSTTPHAVNDLSAPAGLAVSSNGSDADLTWTASSGAFDGYEVLRSEGNNYSFQVVGYASISETTFTDEDALLKDGVTYYYLIRKYKNDVSLVTSPSNAVPAGTVFIGQVSTSNGLSSVSIDCSGARNLLNFEDPIREATNELLLVHNHKHEGSDKRIELKSSVSIQDWVTSDYQTYTTIQDVEGATSYLLTISGDLNDEYFADNNGVVNEALKAQALAGQSPVLYEFLDSQGKIIFNEPLYTDCSTNTNEDYLVVGCPVCPYSAVPTITLQLLDVSEVQGSLPSDRLESFSATKITSGEIASGQMPTVRHEGRMDEDLIPLKLPMRTIDNYVYSLAAQYEGDRNKMGTAVTFYDIIKGEGDSQLVAATSNGVWTSTDFGTTWSQAQTFSAAVHRLYKSQVGNYYAITNYGVYLNSGTSFRSWTEMKGLEYVKAIRDIAEDTEGNLFVSTDLGVFRLNSEFVPYIEDSWEKLPIFGARSSEAYSIVYDGDYADSQAAGRLLVSNELGLLQSTDSGDSWQYITELESNVKVREFVKEGGYIFALSDDAIYRQQSGASQFVKVAELDSSQSRRMVVYDDRLYITTDIGPMSSVTGNIYTASTISFVKVWSKMNLNNQQVIATSLDKVESFLMVGADRRVFIMGRDQKLWGQYEQQKTIVPTFYVDGVLQKLGFYYNNGGSEHNVSFDEAKATSSAIEVANMYDIYFSKHGGWAHAKFDAEFVIYQNDAEFGRSPDSIVLDTAPFSSLTLPSYTDDNAHKVLADTYKANITSNLASLTGSSSPTGDALVTLVADTYHQFELFLAQLYESVCGDFVLPGINVSVIKDRTVINNEGETATEEIPVYYDINTEKGTSYAATVNVVNGMFVFDIPFDRYDVLTFDVKEVTVKNAGTKTHRELEDSFEYAYSGLPSQLSQVQQINLVKLGLFTERTWPGQQATLSPASQMSFVIPRDMTSFDTLNSTINYIEEVSNGTATFSLAYPSKVFYVSETGKMLAGGMGGLLAIDASTFEIEEVSTGMAGYEMVRDIMQAGDYLFLLTERNIFQSADHGVTWSDYNKNGLPSRFYTMGFVANNLVIGASDGVYAKTIESEETTWEKVASSTHPVTIMTSSNVLFAVIDNSVQISANGYSFRDTSLGANLDVTTIARYGYVNTYVGSNQGLYSDNGTFNSLSPSLQEIDLGVFVGSTDTINDVVTGSGKVIIGVSNGSYGIIEGDSLRVREYSALDSIHKIAMVDDDMWLFGGDRVKVPSLDYPIKLSAGVPA